ncbi:MAG: GtrA family protein [Xanthomonadales bacterium]|nr:GtrA family protein [Xanthomonadales bacterium]MCC6595600.1 GtrA family protein [Rhodanobacteraceae bacterium]MDL1869050.1 GtrA family protein [Gammaproteobacteria bacterium PRO6]
MSLLRQGRWYIAIGIAQWLLDWGALVALSHAGVAVAVANVAGRVAGASLGFWLNGAITFAREDAAPRWRQALRFGVLWGSNTLLSTLGVTWVATAFGLSWAWLAKPLVEGLLAIGSFVVSRHWVYR